MNCENPGKTECCCPFCKAIGSYRNSSTAKHIRGIQREVLLAAKSGLDIWIKHLDKGECPVRDSEDQPCD